MAPPDATLNEIAEVHGTFVQALAVRLAPAPGLAEDIAQQVFLEFLGKAGQWDLTRDVRPLLAAMTRNVARRAWREKTRQMPEVMRELAEHIRELAETRDVAWPDEEEKRALRRCLEKLPAKSRRLIDLHYDLQISSVDIASQMEMKADAVRRALFRLREQLRLCIQSSMRGRSA